MTNENPRQSRHRWATIIALAGLAAIGLAAWLVLGSGSGQPAPTGPALLGVRVHGNSGGASILTVTPNTPAAAAGLRGGKHPDVITAVDGTSIESASQLVSAIQQDRAGQKVLITFLRGDATTWARVTLAAKPTTR